jgi:hypothetical protein
MNEVENGVELRASFERGTALLLLADDLAAGGLERGDLCVKVLIGGRGAGISDAGHGNCSFWVCRSDELFNNAVRAQNEQSFPVATCSNASVPCGYTQKHHYKGAPPASRVVKTISSMSGMSCKGCFCISAKAAAVNVFD